MSSPADPTQSGPPAPPVDDAASRAAGEDRYDLLRNIAASTLDEDYARVHARALARQADGEEAPPARRLGWGSALALGVLALLLVTLLTQTTRNASTEAGEKAELVAQVTQGRQRLDQQREVAENLTRANARLTASSLTGTREGDVLSASVQRLGVLVGSIPVTGPGVTVTVDDAPNAPDERYQVLDSDLQQLVNALWESGAEAISVNGQRITTLTSIRQAGEAINVNFVGLAAPYRLSVVCDPKTLPARFAETTHGAAWFDLERRVGLRFSMRTASSLQLPAADPLLRYATVIPEGDS